MKKLTANATTGKPSHFYGKMCALLDLFGSKCLPDEEQIAENAICLELKSAEPFKVGDKVKVNKIGNVFNGAIGEIIDVGNHGSCYVLFPHNQAWFRFCDLEPYTEPEEGHFVVNNEMVDRIIKDGFSKERRLNIATQMASAYIIRVGMAAPSIIATMAFQLADALIAESEKEEKS